MIADGFDLISPEHGWQWEAGIGVPQLTGLQQRALHGCKGRKFLAGPLLSVRPAGLARCPFLSQDTPGWASLKPGLAGLLKPGDEFLPSISKFSPTPCQCNSCLQTPSPPQKQNNKTPDPGNQAQAGSKTPQPGSPAASLCGLEPAWPQEAPVPRSAARAQRPEAPAPGGRAPRPAAVRSDA